MKLPSWRTLIKHGWIIAAALLSGLEVALPLIGDLLPFSALTRALGYFAIVAGAFVARIVVQKRYGAG